MSAPTPLWLRSRTSDELQAYLERLQGEAMTAGAKLPVDAEMACVLFGAVNAVAAEVSRRKAGGK